MVKYAKLKNSTKVGRRRNIKFTKNRLSNSVAWYSQIGIYIFRARDGRTGGWKNPGAEIRFSRFNLKICGRFFRFSPVQITLKLDILNFSHYLAVLRRDANDNYFYLDQTLRVCHLILSNENTFYKSYQMCSEIQRSPRSYLKYYFNFQVHFVV